MPDRGSSSWSLPGPKKCSPLQKVHPIQVFILNFPNFLPPLCGYILLTFFHPFLILKSTRYSCVGNTKRANVSKGIVALIFFSGYIKDSRVYVVSQAVTKNPSWFLEQEALSNQREKVHDSDARMDNLISNPFRDIVHTHDHYVRSFHFGMPLSPPSIRSRYQTRERIPTYKYLKDKKSHTDRIDTTENSNATWLLYFNCYYRPNSIDSIHGKKILSS